MKSIFIPNKLFQTINQFYDYAADDMKCGDMDDHMLYALGLNNISLTVDPYKLVMYDYPIFDEGYDIFPTPPSRRSISHDECVDILFNEMHELSRTFSILGDYSGLITKMINHFRFSNGEMFHSPLLDSAFERQIKFSGFNSPVDIMQKSIQEAFHNAKREINYAALLHNIKLKLSGSRLPKFNRFIDSVNGLGITVHDIYAQEITLSSLDESSLGWRARVHFRAQDHFGLDVTDIKNDLYRQFRFFRIWFFLQRHKDFAFRPFFTNFSATVYLQD